MKINNIVRSKSATAKNPDRCWMNISFERMKIFLDEDYVFVCIIDGTEYIYYGCVRELFNAFNMCGVDVMRNPDRYSFYLDYREGKIYKRVSANDRDVVFMLRKIEDVTMSVRQSGSCNITPQTNMKALFMDWLMENKYEPNTANNYSSLVNTSHRFAKQKLKDNFYAIRDAKIMEEISSELIQTDEFLRSKNRELRKNALKRYVEFLRQSQGDDMSLNDIENREYNIKTEIMDYIDNDKPLFFPNEENIPQHKYKPDTSGVYRGDDYLKVISHLGLRTQGSYISHVRTAMRNLNISEQTFCDGLAEAREKLEEYASCANEQGNASTGWSKYLGFLLGKKVRRNSASREGKPKTRIVSTPRSRHNQEFYMENEFVQSLEDKKPKAIRDYVSHTRSAINAYNLSMESMANLDINELNKYLMKASERGNCATGWRHYLRFLIAVRDKSLLSASFVKLQ